MVLKAVSKWYPLQFVVMELSGGFPRMTVGEGVAT